MSTILVLVHTEADGSLGKGALEAVTAAKKLGGSLVAGVFGEKTDEAANVLAGAGAEKVLAVSGEDFAQPRYGTDAAAAEAIAKAAAADYIVATGTSRIARVLAGVSSRLNGCIDTHVTGISADGGAVTVTRWFYRQRMMAQISRDASPWFISVDPGCFEPCEAVVGSANVESVAVELPDGVKTTTVTGVQAPAADEQTIRPDAKILFVAGAGWTKKQADGKPHVAEAQERIMGFIRGAKASLGSSKSLVDQAGEGQEVLTCMTHMNQVGQTGSTPRHQKGLATCCHGEEPHVVGWRFVNERRAINLDANCGWSQGKTDVLYIADAFEVVKKVNALLES